MTSWLFATGQIGLLGTKASWQLMRECDTFLMIGSTFPYSEFLPKEGQAKAVQIDLDPTMLSLRYPMDVALTGDAAATLAALLPLLTPSRAAPGARPSRRMSATVGGRRRRARISPPIRSIPNCSSGNFPAACPDDAIFAVDTGMSTTFFARAVKMRRGMKTRDLRHAGHHGAGGVLCRWRRNSPFPTGPLSPLSATARCRCWA